MPGSSLYPASYVPSWSLQIVDWMSISHTQYIDPRGTYNNRLLHRFDICRHLQDLESLHTPANLSHELPCIDTSNTIE